MGKNFSILGLYIGGGITTISLALEILLPNLPAWSAWVLLFLGICLIGFGIVNFVLSKEPQADKWVLEAVHFLGTGKWDKQISGDHRLNTIGNVAKYIQQVAYNGDLLVWGNEIRGGVLRSIPKEYWRFYGLKIKSLLLGKSENVETELLHYARVNEPILQGLRTNKRQIKKLYREFKRQKK